MDHTIFKQTKGSPLKQSLGWSWAWSRSSRRGEVGREWGQRSTWLVTSDSCWLICSTPPIATESREPRWGERERVAISAKQMAHRDIPVVFHHINFTPVLPLFSEMWQDGGKSREEKKGWGRWWRGRKQRARIHIQLAMLISMPVSAASDCCQSCLMNKQMRISPKLISSLTILLILLSIYWCNTDVLLEMQFTLSHVFAET